MHRRNHQRRRGAAAVEFGIVTLFFVAPLMIEVWEVGRMVQVQQIVSEAAREGARLASQGYTIQSNGAETQIHASTGTPNVTTTVYQYMYAAGLTNLTATNTGLATDITVTFTFTSPRTSAYIPLATDPAGTSWPTGSYPTDPCYGNQNETFSVNVSVPWKEVRWVNLGFIEPASINYTANWQMMVDAPFTVNVNMPQW